MTQAAADQQIQNPEIQVEEGSNTFARVVVEPLHQGFGTSLGNALRRVLLGSLPGAAVTSVQIEGVLHEFSTIPHVREDVIEFILNVKQIRLHALADRPARLILDVSDRAGPVTAGDIQVPPEYEIVNPQLHLATLDSPQGRLRAEFTVELGRGYIPAGHSDGLPIGVIPVDAIFTPVAKASYRVERTLAGQDTSLERLVLEVWTDDTISGVEAIARSAEMLADLFSLFTRLGKPAPTITAHGLATGMAIAPELYDLPVENLNLSVRAYNCLKRSGIMTVGHILERSEEELLSLRNFGRKSYEEMRDRLIELGILTPEGIAVAATASKAVADEREEAAVTVEEPPSVLEEEEAPTPVETPPPLAAAAPGEGPAAGEAEAETATAEVPTEGEGEREELTEWQRQLLRLRRDVGEE
ncbi:MAG: DNA-directed RNA polymerase subunit alpha [Dehalococcoidia bacterium]